LLAESLGDSLKIGDTCNHFIRRYVRRTAVLSRNELFNTVRVECLRFNVVKGFGNGVDELVDFLFDGQNENVEPNGHE
jgi:hypothetical protein